MSQMTSLQKALKAWLKVRVLVNTAAVTDKKAQAPVGKGSSTSPECTYSCQLTLAALAVHMALVYTTGVSVFPEAFLGSGK